MSASLLGISRSPPAAPRDGTHRARVLVTRARALAALERHGDAEGAANAGLAVAGRGRYPPAQWRALALKADFARPTGRPGDADAYAAPASGVVRAVTDPLPGAFRRTLLASADVPA